MKISLTNLSFLEQILEEDEESSECVIHDFPEQLGPLRHFDREKRCASRGCSSPTHFKLQGVPYCMIHCLRKMNDMLFESGVEK